MAALVAAGVAGDAAPATAEESARTRLPWTASRLRGSPDPGKRCTSEAVFPGIELNQGLELVAHAGRFHVVERGGRLWSFPERPSAEAVAPDLTIDLKALHPGLTNAYGLAFHPRCADNGEVFVAYTIGNNVEDGTRVSRFRLSGANPPRIDPASEETVITWWSGGHNGAALQFGPDGFLYLSTGDGTAPSPPDGKDTGQDNGDLLSAILRIDVDARDPGRPYRVPPDNPYVGREGVRPEIWSFGFRNPWKMSFDGQGRLWVGDVGWERWEMIHLAGKGSNHGWSAMEASQPIKPGTASALSPILPPVAAHPHSEAASITGGFVYEGARMPELRGAYLYGDYETGKIWALWHEGGRVVRHEEIADTPHKIATFGVGGGGELYYLHYGSPATVHRLAPNPRAGKAADFPLRLSETGLFRDTARRVPQDGVHGYEVIEPLWQDGAAGERQVALPDGAAVDTEITFRPNGSRQVRVVWPEGAVLAKTIRLGSRPVETQVLLFDGETWNGYAYQWNEAGSDAVLVPAAGAEVDVAGADWEGGPRYRIASRAECLRCHTMWNEFVAGFHPLQLAGFSQFPGQSPREVAVALGLTDGEFFDREEGGRLAPSGSNGSLERRARSWLHANCSHCHRRHGGGSAPLEVNFDRALSESALLWQAPTRGDFGLPGARAVVPGEPWRSVLNYRVAAIGSGHMPPLGAREVDEAGAALLWEWVAGLPRETEAPPPPLPDRFDPALLEDTASAMRLAHSLAVAKGWEESERQRAIEAGLASARGDVRALFERFRDPADRPPPRRHDPGTVLRLSGDPAAGAKLLSPAGKLAACLACHRVGAEGRDFGPDLTEVGDRLDRAGLLESLTDPSKVVTPGFALWTVETRDGRIRAGFSVERNPERLVLRTDPETLLRIPDGEIKSATPQPGSAMPAGLTDFLTDQELADLLAWLGSLKKAQP